MIPSDRGFKREANAPKASMSTLQKVVRYAEKDDILLYLTAAFGVLMPGIMYFFYRYVHKRYQQIKRAKKQQKSQKEERRTATIFYCSDIQATREIAYELAENLQFDPLVAKLSAQEMDKARHSKAVYIFVLSDDCKQDAPSRLAEFIDWLDEVKYERRQKNYLRNSRFLVIYLSANGEDPPPEPLSQPCGQTVHTLERKLASLESMPLGQAQVIRTSNKKDMCELCNLLSDLMKRFTYGEFDLPDLSVDESMEEYSEDEGSE